MLAAAILISIFAGAFTPFAALVFSLVALGLVYGLALWSVIAETRGLRLE